MDEIVLKGMAKWPDVPAVYGWLSLDRRGEWLLKGEMISHPAVVAFIGRNYDHDERGRWYFQNGPQRVYVDLEYTPFVYRASLSSDGGLEFEAHTGGRARAANAAWLDEEGAFLIDTDLGVGLVHDRDLPVVLTALVDGTGRRLSEEEIESRTQLSEPSRADPLMYLRGIDAPLPVRRIQSASVAARFRYEPHPRDRQ